MTVLKLLKMATGMRALLDTVVQALPQVNEAISFYRGFCTSFFYLFKSAKCLIRRWAEAAIPEGEGK